MLKRKSVISLTIFAFAVSILVEACAGCTIGVASGRATSDRRPMIWKTRDTSKKDNAVIYNTSLKYKFISVVNAGSTSAWQGLNEHGFAILNSLSKDLSGKSSSGRGNGSLMRHALGNCITIADFEQLLETTNVSGRKTRANFGVLDATGAVAFFEASNHKYWKFDATDPNVAPNGYLLRANFAFNGSGKNGIEGLYSAERYQRTTTLINRFYSTGNLNYRSILRTQMRDFSDHTCKPVPVPFSNKSSPDSPLGYIRCDKSICRSSSVSASVIVGVLPGESVKLSTMWTILGQPACSIAVPYWPVCETPAEAHDPNTAALCDTALMIKSLLFDYEDDKYIDSFKLRNGKDGGLWAITFPAEDRIFTQTEEKLMKWRKTGPNIGEMAATEARFAADALSVLKKAYVELKTSAPDNRKSAKPNLELINN